MKAFIIMSRILSNDGKVVINPAASVIGTRPPSSVLTSSMAAHQPGGVKVSGGVPSTIVTGDGLSSHMAAILLPAEVLTDAVTPPQT